MHSSDKPGSAPKPRVNFLRRRPRPGALVRAPDDLALPHERDQADGAMTGGIASPDVQQGHRDLQRGVQDTTKSTEMDRTYQRQK
jgi:hypothetical protein